MRLKGSCKTFLLSWLCAATLVSGVAGQTFRGAHVASVVPQEAVALKRGETVVVPLKVRIRSGYHINSNAPMGDYLIPTRLTWDVDELALKEIRYPEAEFVSYEFSEEPLSVYSDVIVIESAFDVPRSAAGSLKELSGTLRYQACNNKACLPPKTLDVKVPVLWR